MRRRRDAAPTAGETPALRLPRLYAIVDPALVRGEDEQAGRVAAFARELIAGGAGLIQYRNKKDSARQILSDARELRRAAPERVRLIMNDRADLCLAAGFDGVHLGQEDLSVAGARVVAGERLWVGVSTHSTEQVDAAERTSADYIAIGPVFPTASKENPDPVIGLAGVRAARAATRKPLVAIGGITRVNCLSVIEAGADSVAVISDLLVEPTKSVEAFLRVLG